MKWLEFVKQYRNDHPHLSYKETLQACKGDWKKHKVKKDYCPKLRPKKKEITAERRLSKKLREEVKEQCGIHKKPRALTPKKRKRKPKSGVLSLKLQMEGSAKLKVKRKRKKKSQVSR